MVLDDLDLPRIFQTDELLGLEIETGEVVDGIHVRPRVACSHLRLLDAILLE